MDAAKYNRIWNRGILVSPKEGLNMCIFAFYFYICGAVSPLGYINNYVQFATLRRCKWVFVAEGAHCVCAHELGWFAKVPERDKSSLITYLSVLFEK